MGNRTPQMVKEVKVIRAIRDRNKNMAVVKLAKKIENCNFNPDTLDYTMSRECAARSYLSILSVVRRHDDRCNGTEKTLPKAKRRKPAFTTVPHAPQLMPA